MNKKEPIKVPEGYAKGSKTYGDLCKPKSSLKFKALDYQEAGSRRIIALMERGSQADSLTRKEKPITDEQQIEDLEFRNKLAEQPKIVQFAFWKSKLDEVRHDLLELKQSKNEKKALLMIPAVESQIEFIESTMRELFNAIREERGIK